MVAEGMMEVAEVEVSGVDSEEGIEVGLEAATEVD